MDLKRGWG